MPNIYYNKKIPADENTLALLHFDESVTRDACGNTWSVIGSPTLTTNAKFGKAIYFNGSSGIYLKTSNLAVQTSPLIFGFTRQQVPALTVILLTS